MAQAQNVITRVSLLQLLVYFEGVNIINAQINFPFHPFTQTPQAIREALEAT